jgi:hypothetical protein
MRCSIAIMGVLALPGPAFAHAGSHGEMGLVTAIAHLLGQHAVPLLVAAPVVALLLICRARTPHDSARYRQDRLDREERGA